MPKFIHIDNFDAPELDVYVRLTGAQLRSRVEPSLGVFIAESPTVVEVALNSGCEPISLLTDERFLHGKVEELIARMGDIPIYVASRDILRTLTGFELTRGVLCAMKRPVSKNIDDLCRDAKRIAVLENITDSTNIGAIFRSASALAVDAVLLTPSCCDPLCRRAVRVSMGTVLQVPWGRIGDAVSDWPERGLEKLHELGFTTLAMALSDNSLSLGDPRLPKIDKLAIVLGTEGDGLSHSTVASCTYTVKIPMSHGVDSLNVASAGAVAFWQLCANR